MKNQSRPQPKCPPEKAARDNRANQLNPNNGAYWSSRGLERPTPANQAVEDASNASGLQRERAA